MKAFSRAAEKLKRVSGDDFLGAILYEHPDLAGQTTYTPQQGSTAHVIIIGNEVFKTPRADKEVTVLAREHDTLQYLKRKNFPVPEVTCAGKNSLFFGMTLMPGLPLLAEEVEKMQKEDRVKLAKEIAGFCVDLSTAVSEKEAKNNRLNIPRVLFEPDRMRARLADAPVQKVLGNDYSFCKQVMERYIDQHEKKYPVGVAYLMQGDLNPGNIFYDPDTKKLSGIIDFGITRFTWPEDGLVNFCAQYRSDDFIEAMLKEYSRLQPVRVTSEEVKLLACAQYIDSIDPQNDIEKTREAVSRLRKWLGDSFTAQPALKRREAPKTP